MLQEPPLGVPSWISRLPARSWNRCHSFASRKAERATSPPMEWATIRTGWSVAVSALPSTVAKALALSRIERRQS